MASKKKSILAYFLKETGGMYTTAALQFLFDLLSREGMLDAIDNTDSLGLELGMLLKDGSYLRVATKSIPQHIRAQIDFNLKRSKKQAKSSRVFESLLTDEDDPRFTMDTALGLNFSTLDELANDLKKKAVTTVGPLWRRTVDSRQHADDHHDFPLGPGPQIAVTATEEKRERDARLHSSGVSPGFEDDLLRTLGLSDADVLQGAAQDIAGIAGNSAHDRINSAQNSDASFMDINEPDHYAQREREEQLYSHHVPEFPQDLPAVSSNESDSRRRHMPSLPSASAAFVAGDAHDWSPSASPNVDPGITPGSVELADNLRTRSAIIDAKERLLSQKIKSLQDPLLLNALSLVDQKVLQSTRSQTLNSADNAANNAIVPVITSAVPTAAIPAVAGTYNATAQNGIELLQRNIQDIISVQNSMAQLQQALQPQIVQSQRAGDTSGAGSSAGSATQKSKAESDADSRKRLDKSQLAQMEQLRSQINLLERELESLTPKLKQLGAVVKSNKSGQSGRGKSGKSVSAHLGADPDFSADFAEPTDSAQFNPQVGSGQPLFDTASPVLQKIFFMLAVGMRELGVAPTRAAYMYSQIQRLYSSLTLDEKPLVYPSIIAFHQRLCAIRAGGRR